MAQRAAPGRDGTPAAAFARVAVVGSGGYIRAMIANPGALVRAVRAALVAAVVGATGAAPGAAQAQPPRAPRPTLVVVVTVDQLRGDYPTRFGPTLTGGLRRLLDGVHAVHDHANTETAPGHAVTLSGRFPVHTGIAANIEGVQDRTVTLIGAAEAGASPWRFRGTTLVDWLRAADPRSRVLSVSRKDRGAILPIGRSKGDVYWYASNGTFTQSTYYGRALPGWVRDFNATRRPMRYAGWVWEPLLDSAAYPAADSIPTESLQGLPYTFPYVLPEDSAQAAALLPGVPPMDALTLEFALAGIRALALGADSTRTDLVNIALSTTDAVGHRWGPDSRELHDQVVRLDRSLGAFLDTLFTLRDSSRIVIALTSDHGITPLPGSNSPSTPNPAARYVDARAVRATHVARMQAAGIDTMVVDYVDGLLVIGDTSSFVKRRLSVDSVVRAFAADLRRVDGIHRADLLHDLARADTVQDMIARRWLHTFAPGGRVRLVTTLERFNYWHWATNVTHGSPWEQDAWVPLVLWGAPFRRVRHEPTVRVVDLAPTLAAVLGVAPTEPVDGVVLRELLAPPPR